MECKKCGIKIEKGKDFCENCKEGDTRSFGKLKVEGLLQKNIYRTLIPVVAFIAVCWLTIAIVAVGNEFDAIVGSWIDEESGKSIAFNYGGYGEGAVTSDFSPENIYRYMSSDKLTLLIIKEQNLTKSIGIRGSMKIQGNKMTWTPETLVRPFIGEASIDPQKKSWKKSEYDYPMSDIEIKQWKWEEVKIENEEYFNSIFTEYSIGKTVTFKRDSKSFFGSWKGSELKNSAETLTFNPNGTFVREYYEESEYGTFTENEGKLALTLLSAEGDTPSDAVTYNYTIGSMGNNLTLTSPNDKMMYKRK